MKINNPILHTLLFTSMLLVTLTARADETFKDMGTCGSASVDSIESCPKAKIKFQFDGCLLKSEPQLATKIICEKSSLKALFQSGDLKYQVLFEKTDSGWGGEEWKPTSGLMQFKKITPISTIKHRKIKEKTSANKDKQTAKQEDTIPKTDNLKTLAPSHQGENPAVTKAIEPAPTPSTPTPTVNGASPFKFSGFADLRYTHLFTKDNPFEKDGLSQSGFCFEDGAFYGNYEQANLAVILDIALRRTRDADSDLAAANPNQSSNNSFSIGLDKSQLYLKYKLSSWLLLDFGQFDALFGLEASDSKDRVFGKTGIVSDTLPSTHTGLMVETLNHGFYTKSFIANPISKGSFGTSSNGDNRPEYGAVLGYSGTFRGQVGYMARSINNLSGDKGTRSLMDVAMGATWGPFNLDLEYNRLSDPMKNTLTVDKENDLESPGQGAIVLASYKFTPELQLGLRYEYTQDDPSQMGLQNMYAQGANIHYKILPELELRLEYTTTYAKPMVGNSWQDHRMNIATLIIF